MDSVKDIFSVSTALKDVETQLLAVGKVLDSKALEKAAEDVGWALEKLSAMAKEITMSEGKTNGDSAILDEIEAAVARRHTAKKELVEEGPVEEKSEAPTKPPSSHRQPMVEKDVPAPAEEVVPADIPPSALAEEAGGDPFPETESEEEYRARVAASLQQKWK